MMVKVHFLVLITTLVLAYIDILQVMFLTFGFSG